MPPVLVDLFCNDLEIGKSVTMSEVGPTSAYVEHKSPLPVGAELRLHTDEGAEVGAVVVRVHENVADAAREPGMYVRVVEIGPDTETWWKNHLDKDADPVFPERAIPGSVVATARTHTVDMSTEELARMAAEDRTEASAAAPMPGPPPEDDSAPNAKPTPDKKATLNDINTTLKMTPDQVRQITELAPEDESGNETPPAARNGTSMGMAVAVPPPDVVAEGETTSETNDTNNEPKKKRKRRRKKKS